MAVLSGLRIRIETGDTGGSFLRWKPDQRTTGQQVAKLPHGRSTRTRNSLFGPGSPEPFLWPAPGEHIARSAGDHPAQQFADAIPAVLRCDDDQSELGEELVQRGAV